MAFEQEMQEPDKDMAPWSEVSLVAFLEKDVDKCYGAITHAKWAFAIVKLAALAIVVQTTFALWGLLSALTHSALPIVRIDSNSFPLAIILVAAIGTVMLMIIVSTLLGAYRIARRFIVFTRKELRGKAEIIQKVYDSHEVQVPSDVRELLSRMNKI